MAAGQLVHPAITVLTARAPDRSLLGMGALRDLAVDHGELKAVHVRATARGCGVGRALVVALVDLARERGVRRVSLETGTMDAFSPARTLYESVGFLVCPPFGQYEHSPNSVCMTLLLDPRRDPSWVPRRRVERRGQAEPGAARRLRGLTRRAF